ncbi:putative isopropanol dehydrogenase [Mycena capillaripes]|nr:putative isopropanol dehydrogenase [Mycena capillaripes]
MKALVLHGPKDLRLDDVPEPTAQPGSIVVRVLAAPVWDYLPEVVNGGRQYPLAYPLIFGTCAVGRVELVGPDVTLLTPGQLVFCDYIVRLRDEPDKRIVLGYHGGMTVEEIKLSSGHWKDGCFAELASFPAENVHLVDEQLLTKQEISIHQLAEIASVMPGMGAANSIGIKAGETVLVLPSTGFFSSSAIVAALALGAHVVAGSRSKDSLDALIAFFGEDGAKRITPVVLSGNVDQDAGALLAATPGGKGADTYIDYSPPTAATTTHIMAGLLALKRYGRCCFAGVIIDNVQLPYALIMANCLIIRGQFAQSREDVVQTVKLIEAGNMKLKKKIIGPYPFEEYSQVMDLAAQSKGWEKMILFGP